MGVHMRVLDCGGWFSPGWVKFYIYTRVSQQLSGGLSPVPAGGGSEALTRYWWIVPVNSPHTQLLLLTCPDWLIHPFIRSLNQITSSLPHCGENEAAQPAELPVSSAFFNHMIYILSKHIDTHARARLQWLWAEHLMWRVQTTMMAMVKFPIFNFKMNQELSFHTASFIQPVSRHFRNEFTQTSPIPIDCINLVFDKTYCAVNKCVCMSRMLNTKL